MRRDNEPGWRQFEDEVRLLAQEFGYRAETTRAAGDGGIDVVAHGQRGKVVIQCKFFGRGKVGGPAIDQLAGTRVREKAVHAICVTTTGFTKQAEEFAKDGAVLLVGRDKLLALCQKKRLTLPCLTVLHRGPQQTPDGVISLRLEVAPSSPRDLQLAVEEVLPIPGASVHLGRAPDCEIVVQDPRISRRHARLEREGLKLRLYDCGSTNGTAVNGCRINQPHELRYEDEIQIGSCVLRVVLADGRTVG